MSNSELAYQYFLSKGYSPSAAAGIVGNLVQESGVNPAVRPGDNGTAHGIAQWRGDRWTGLQNYAGQNNGDVNGLNTQLGYLDYELRNKYPSVFKQLTGAQNARDATAAFALGYERPAGAQTGVAENVDGWKNRLNAAMSVGGGSIVPDTQVAGPVPAGAPEATGNKPTAMAQLQGLLGQVNQQSKRGGGLLSQPAQDEAMDYSRFGANALEFHNNAHQAFINGLLGRAG